MQLPQPGVPWARPASTWASSWCRPWLWHARHLTLARAAAAADDSDESYEAYKSAVKHIAADRTDAAALKEKLSGQQWDGELVCRCITGVSALCCSAVPIRSSRAVAWPPVAACLTGQAQGWVPRTRVFVANPSGGCPLYAVASPAAAPLSKLRCTVLSACEAPPFTSEGSTILGSACMCGQCQRQCPGHCFTAMSGGERTCLH